MSLIPSNIFVGHYDPFCHNVWDPFEEFHYGGPMIIPHHAFPSEATSLVTSMTDWKETSDGHLVLKAHLPGFKREEVKVDVEEGRVLSIRGEKKVEREENHDGWHRFERSSGKFIRRLRLPENAKAEKMKVFVENGMLTVTVPKENVVKYHPHTRMH
ncbi:hypothetical protein ACFX13_033528 [Malus domestica]|uniref:SHSP domain-containing protein n=1 Tax=Malus domestica TaxID=3750 RepID=A0A498K3N8_MALDO|nr:18.1 kDa class I heat shock protein-like [Malus domestica]RXI02141.1 hypothetical protein DVH24_026671 [Malus domestica]